MAQYMVQEWQSNARITLMGRLLPVSVPSLLTLVFLSLSLAISVPVPYPCLSSCLAIAVDTHIGTASVVSTDAPRHLRQDRQQQASNTSHARVTVRGMYVSISRKSTAALAAVRLALQPMTGPSRRAIRTPSADCGQETSKRQSVPRAIPRCPIGDTPKTSTGTPGSCRVPTLPREWNSWLFPGLANVHNGQSHLPGCQKTTVNAS